MRMKRLIAWRAGVLLFLSWAVVASAADQKKTSTKEDRLSGTVHMIDRDSSSIIVRKGAVQRKVIYNTETKFTIRNNPDASIDDVIVGRHVICLGRFNDKTQLVATRVDIQTK